jgi:PAS domain S-box-containing protein
LKVAALDSADDAIVTVKLDGTVVTWPSSAERLFKYPAKEIKRKPILLLIPADHREQFSVRLSKIAQGEHVAPYDTVWVAKGGGPLAVSVQVSPIQAGREIVGASIIARAVSRNEVSERPRSEGEPPDANLGRDEFLALLGHELRNPLTPIRNGLEIMRLIGMNDPELADVRDMMERQVYHLSRLVDGLVDVSRITRGKVKLRKEVVSLRTLVAQAIESCRSSIDKGRHRLSLVLPDESLRSHGDPIRLCQVFSNLISNSVRHSPEESEITISIEREGDYAVLRVRDEGIGIAADLLPRIFNLFVKGPSTGLSQGGLGIGLMLARSLVEMHGGSILAHSEGIGKGAEFVVRLPLIADQPSNKKDTGPKASRVTASGRRRRVLVVDDNLDAAASLAAWLKMHGHEIFTTHDGPSALILAKKNRPDAVFLDIGLPGMDGFEVARRLRQELGLKKALIVAVTGYGADRDRCRSQAAGFSAHLVKPVDLNAVQHLLEETTNGRD